VVWREEAPDGKVDLPAASWHEKDDLSNTDMHPFLYAFAPAILPPWQTHTDYDALPAIAGRFSELSA
jgi:nitrate reductase / nitrite oxidoreductase, alpha subunit